MLGTPFFRKSFEVFKKLEKKVEKLQIVFFGQPEALLRPNEIYLKKTDWETDKLKLDPTFFSFFEIFEQNPAKWWVDHQNPTKTRRDRFK